MEFSKWVKLSLLLVFCRNCKSLYQSYRSKVLLKIIIQTITRGNLNYAHFIIINSTQTTHYSVYLRLTIIINKEQIGRNSPNKILCTTMHFRGLETTEPRLHLRRTICSRYALVRLTNHHMDHLDLGPCKLFSINKTMGCFYSAFFATAVKNSAMMVKMGI